jgi:hypothetical protein
MEFSRELQRAYFTVHPAHLSKSPSPDVVYPLGGTLHHRYFRAIGVPFTDPRAWTKGRETGVVLVVFAQCQ